MDPAMSSMTLVIQGLPPDTDGPLPWEYPGVSDELVDVGLTLNGTAELSFPMQLDRLRWSLDLQLPQLDVSLALEPLVSPPLAPGQNHPELICPPLGGTSTADLYCLQLHLA
jgi:hypothetical protein